MPYLCDHEASPKGRKNRWGRGDGLAGKMMYLVAGGDRCPAMGPECLDCYGAESHFRPNVDAARYARVDDWYEDRPGFLLQLAGEVRAHRSAAIRAGKQPIVRLNGLSDIDWDRYPVPGYGVSIYRAFPDVQFYEYTRVPGILARHLRGELPGNVDLTFSLGATNDRIAHRAILAGVRVAVVFPKKTDFPATWGGFPVIDGEGDDYRFLDPHGVIVALSAKKGAIRPDAPIVRGGDGGFDLARVPVFVRAEHRAHAAALSGLRSPVVIPAAAAD